MSTAIPELLLEGYVVRAANAIQKATDIWILFCRNRNSKIECLLL